MPSKPVKWLLEKDVFEENLERLEKEIVKQGMEFSSISYIPFKGEITYPFGDDACVICYGSLNLVARMQREVPWVPGSWCTLKNFECTTYYTHFGKFLLNQDYMMMPLQEVLRLQNTIYERYGIDGCIFVRPNSGFKPFTGCVMPHNEISADAFGYGYYHEDASLLVVVSEPKIIDVEWRFVIADKKVIAGSQYRRDGKLCIASGYDKDGFEFAQQVAQSEWEPDAMYVLDVCRQHDGDCRLLEINAFSTSGLYQCDLAPIVSEAKRIAIREYEDVL